MRAVVPIKTSVVLTLPAASPYKHHCASSPFPAEFACKVPGAGGPEGKDANTIPVSLPSLMVTLEEEDLWEEVAEEEVEEVRLRLDLLDDIGSVR